MMLFILLILKVILMLVPLLISVAYLTLAERKILSSMQKRRGPNIVGVYGLMQPLADGLKLFLKETIVPTRSNIVIFFIAPIVTFSLAIISWGVVPFNEYSVYSDLNLGLLYIFAISSLSVYGIIISGWSSNSKYAFLGSLRSTAQMISYEVSIGLIVVCVIFCAGSFNLTEIVSGQIGIWYILPLFPLSILFFISALAETNRPPFDLPEAEAELVSGYNVEYSGMTFALFFLGEQMSIILMCTLFVILFLGGWNPILNYSIFYYVPSYIWFSVKVIITIFSFIWVRAAFPRYRYDQLMRLGWKVILPISLAFVILVPSLLLSFDLLY